MMLKVSHLNKARLDEIVDVAGALAVEIIDDLAPAMHGLTRPQKAFLDLGRQDVGFDDECHSCWWRGDARIRFWGQPICVDCLERVGYSDDA